MNPERLNILMASLSCATSSPAFYEKALRKSHNVVTFGPHRDRKFWAHFSDGIKTWAFYRPGTSEHWLDICSRLSAPCDIVTQQGMVDLRELMPRLPPGFRPDLFIWIDQHEWNLPFYFDVLNCPTVGIFQDTHLHRQGNCEVWLAYARQFDFVFLTFDRRHMRDFKEAGCERVFWSPAACDPEVHCQVPAEKIYPISFVGGTSRDLHADRVALLEHLQKRGVDVHIDSKVLHDMALIFSRSKIVLNKSLSGDLNMRVFEALSCGSLLLTDRLDPESGLEDLFKDREHLVLYDRNNLLDLIHYYLKHDEERERIASAGRSAVLRSHTYGHRISEIIRTVTGRPSP